jgi:hypothetical protein
MHQSLKGGGGGGSSSGSDHLTMSLLLTTESFSWAFLKLGT